MLPPGMPPPGAPDPKRPRTDAPPGAGGGVPGGALQPEAEFAATVGGAGASVKITVHVPVDDSTPSWGLNGQALALELPVMTTIKDVKEKLAALCGGMPANKQQLKSGSLGFLKDSLSLAHFNLGNGAALQLVPKSRGGRR